MCHSKAPIVRVDQPRVGLGVRPGVGGMPGMPGMSGMSGQEEHYLTLTRLDGLARDLGLCFMTDFQSPIHTDLTLWIAGRAIPCHKLMLVGCSRLFRRLLDPSDPEPAHVSLGDPDRASAQALQDLIPQLYLRLSGLLPSNHGGTPEHEAWSHLLELEPFCWRPEAAPDRPDLKVEIDPPIDVKPSVNRLRKRPLAQNVLPSNTTEGKCAKLVDIKSESWPAITSADKIYEASQESIEDVSTDTEGEGHTYPKQWNNSNSPWVPFLDSLTQGQGSIANVKPYKEGFTVESRQKNKRRYTMKKNAPFRAIVGVKQPNLKIGHVCHGLPLAWSDPNASLISLQFDRFVRTAKLLFGFSDQDLLFNTKLLHRQGRSSEKVASIKDHIRRGMLTKFSKYKPEQLQELLNGPELMKIQAQSQPRPLISFSDQASFQIDIVSDLCIADLQGVIMLVWDEDQKCLRSRDFVMIQDPTKLGEQGDYFLSILFDTWCTSSESLPETSILESCFERVAKMSFLPKVVHSLLSEKLPQKQCPECGQVFPHLTPAQQAKYKLHKDRHEVENFQCDCDEVFGDDTKKKRHILIKHSNGLYVQCSQCVFIGVLSELSAHEIEYHRSFICDICGKVLPTKSSASSHYRDLHKPYQCETCYKEFIGYRYFNVHSRSHMDPWTCQHCSSVFKAKSMLDKHLLRMHTNDNEKPFQCNLCGKGFIYQRALDAHSMNAHIKSRPWACRYGCGSSYNDTSNRNHHERKKHGKTWEGSNP
ncbi:hypothetical protein TCAL_05878 [Tigriopus californicus]|uniref:BTB domain-containing protein n=2 Tax=Tigriopus californicus TaxID=6832 RepID=A0A553NNT9_TIGCA|nr:hypothetical protein TCAL_05878 [Tigriopus californicus]|eukprot:TCALIF_05878-PA protein Name:"Similar to Zfp26 Zinc finger protein 26 (Mus musculus)" AED:0.32 eAED:0.32 QI:0/1/0.5/1/0/0/2/107/757